MKQKTVRESSIVMAQQMNPQDANPAGNVHGGVIMKLIDTAAGAVAVRHARSNAVTASIDRLVFGPASITSGGPRWKWASGWKRKIC